MDKNDQSLSSNGYHAEVIFSEDMDLIRRYDGMFTPLELDEEQYYLEQQQDKNTSFRFIITPGGVVAISSENTNEIWQMTGEQSEEQALLLELNLIAKEARTFDIRELVKELHCYRKRYFLRILPYGDRHTSAVIRDMLDPRYELFKK